MIIRLTVVYIRGIASRVILDRYLTLEQIAVLACVSIGLILSSTFVPSKERYITARKPQLKRKLLAKARSGIHQKDQFGISHIITKRPGVYM